MKKLMLISLFVIPFCKAADPYEHWDDAVKKIHGWEQINWSKVRYLEFADHGLDEITIPGFRVPDATYLNLGKNQLEAFPAKVATLTKLRTLLLNNNRIKAIPDNLQLSMLRTLYLSHNDIQGFDHKKLLKQFPNLTHLDLSNNPDLDPEYVDALIAEAQAAARHNLQIIANNIGPRRSEGCAIKGE